jgi:hypothetical protein
MTDAATIQAVRLFPAVLQRVSAVPLPPAVHRIQAVQLRLKPAVLLRLAVLLTRTVQLRLVPAVQPRLAVLLIRTVQLRLVPAVQTPAVLLRAVMAVVMSAAKAARPKMRVRSPS